MDWGLYFVQCSCSSHEPRYGECNPNIGCKQQDLLLLSFMATVSWCTIIFYHMGYLSILLLNHIESSIIPSVIPQKVLFGWLRSPTLPVLRSGCMEPVATVAVGFALGHLYRWQVLATLLPICGGAAWQCEKSANFRVQSSFLVVL